MNKILGTSKVNVRNRIHITSIKTCLNVGEGDFVKFVLKDNGEVVLEKV